MAFTSTIKPYKFVNPSSISGSTKSGGATIIAAGKKITGGSDSQVKSARVTMLAINRLGMSLQGLGQTQQQIRDIIVHENKYLEKSSDFKKRIFRYRKDQKSEDTSESFGKKDKEGVEKEVVKKEKKSLGWLEKIFGPFAGIISFVGKIIVTQTILRWMADPKNGERLVVFVKSISTIFKWAFNIAFKSIDAILSGFSKVFGSSDKKGLDRFGEVLGGLGQLLIGVAGLKALGYLLNPFSLVSDIAGLIDIINKKPKQPPGGGGAPIPGGGTPAKELSKAAQKVGENYGNDASRYYDDLIARGKKPKDALAAVRGKFKKLPPPPKPKGPLGKLKQGVMTRFDDLKFMAKKGIADTKSFGKSAIATGQKAVDRTKAFGKFALEEGKKLGVGVLEKGKEIAAGSGKWLKTTGQQMQKMRSLVTDPKALMAYANDLIATKVRPAINKNPIAKTVIDLVKNPKQIPSAVGNLVKTASKSKEALTLIKYLKTVKDTVKVSGIDKIIGILTGLIDYGLLGTPMVNAFLGAIGGLLGYTGGFALGAPFGGITGFFTGAAGGFAGEFIGRELAKLIGKGPLGKIKDPIMKDGRMLASPELAEGGVVNKPTRAIIGEAGPEAIIPLNKLGSTSPTGFAETIIGGVDSALSRMGAAGEVARSLIGSELNIAKRIFGANTISGGGGDTLGKSVMKFGGQKDIEVDAGDNISLYLGDQSVTIRDTKGGGNAPVTLRGQLANLLGSLIWLGKKDLSGGGSGGSGGGGSTGGSGSAGDNSGGPVALEGGKWPDLLNLILKYEAGANGYESMYPSTKLPGATKMTIAQVASRATGAVGAWQNLPEYLNQRAKAVGLDPKKDLYNPKNQQLIAEYLIGPGQANVSVDLAKSNPKKAMYKLSQVWAAIPKDDSGKSYYAGDGVNKAHIKPHQVYDAFKKLSVGGKVEDVHPLLTKLNDKNIKKSISGPGLCVTGSLDTMQKSGVPNPAATGSDVGNNPRGAIVQLIKSFGWKSIGGSPKQLNSAYGKVSTGMYSKSEYSKAVDDGLIPSGALIFQTRHSDWDGTSYNSRGYDMAIALKKGNALWNGDPAGEYPRWVYGASTKSVIALSPGGKAGDGTSGGGTSERQDPSSNSGSKPEEPPETMESLMAKLKSAVSGLNTSLGIVPPEPAPAPVAGKSSSPASIKDIPKPQVPTSSTPTASQSGKTVSDISGKVKDLKQAAKEAGNYGHIVPLPINNTTTQVMSSGTEVYQARTPITYGI